MNQPQTFRKRPVEVLAMNWDGSHESGLSIAHWVNCGGIRTAQLTPDGLVIRTLEGDMKASPGDWIIRGVNGEFYPCKPDIFEKTYQRGA